MTMYNCIFQFVLTRYYFLFTFLEVVDYNNVFYFPFDVLNISYISAYVQNNLWEIYMTFFFSLAAQM